MTYFNYTSQVPAGWYTWIDSNGVIVERRSTTPANLPNPTVKSGSSVPGYVEKIRKGIDASSAYTRKGYNYFPGSYTMRSEQMWGGQRVKSLKTERSVLGQPILSFTASDVTLDASNRLKRKLRSLTGQSNQLTNVAELRELPRTIRSVAGSATGLVKAVLNSNRRGSDLRKFASDQWLTWSFGILPTLSAVDDAIQSVQSYLDRKDHHTVEYGVHSKDWLSSTSGITSGSHHFNVSYNGSFKHNLSAKITAGYRYQLRSSENYHAAKHLGFDISSVVPTAWELLPYSWLVDYFTTAGQFIEDTFAADFGQSIYITQNVKFRVEGIITFRPVQLFSASPLVYWHSIPSQFEYFEFTRTPLSSLPRAPLRFKTSDEIANNAINKLLNLTALLGSKK